MAFKSEAHRRWWFANRANGGSGGSGASSGGSSGGSRGGYSQGASERQREKEAWAEQNAYKLVMGPYGKAFVDDIIGISNSQDIFSTNDWIKSNYKSAFAVDDLAQNLNMSVASFHRKFKAAIGMGPLQCQKQLRLVEARRSMLNEGHSVTDVALDVGYESMSQFSREYKRMFGLPPQRDIQALRAQTA